MAVTAATPLARATVAALVATIGLAQKAQGQVAEHFDAVAARQVPRSQEMGGDYSRAMGVIPWDGPERVGQINGVEAAGTFSSMKDAAPDGVRTVEVVDPQDPVEQRLPVVAASPGLLDAVQGDVVTGRFFDEGHDERADRVVVLGARAAESLNVNRVDSQLSVFIGDESYTVIGIVEDVVRRNELVDSVIVPNGTARDRFGLEAIEELHIHTVLGGAELAGRQGPIALDSERPEVFEAKTPPAPGDVRDRVQADVNALFLALGGVALLVGALGIANVTLLSVLERVGEIGLRRALGATRRHVSNQFLLESVPIGLLGGLVGTAVGVLVTLGVSIFREWTPLLEPGLAAGAPLLGAVIGLIAGTYPAWKASAIEPITALRSD